jgi:hypothetical protein
LANYQTLRPGSACHRCLKVLPQHIYIARSSQPCSARAMASIPSAGTSSRHLPSLLLHSHCRWPSRCPRVSPERGLYNAIVGGFLVSALGGSRFQTGGPAGAFIVLVAALSALAGLPVVVGWNMAERASFWICFVNLRAHACGKSDHRHHRWTSVGSRIFDF